MSLLSSAAAVENAKEYTTQVYLTPVQVSENTYEYYNEDGTLFCTWVAESEMTSKTLSDLTANATKYWVSWTLMPQAYRHDDVALNTGGAVVEFHHEINSQGGTLSYVGFYTPATGVYKWVDPPTTGNLTGHFLLGSSQKVNFAMKNAGKSPGMYAGSYWIQ